jgi:hypothetical protein
MARSAMGAQTVLIVKGEAMNTSIKSIVTAAALLGATLGAVGTANAQAYVPAQPWQPEHGYYYDNSGRVHRVNPYPDRYAQHDACRAPRWNPQTRYMPGDTVWRNGELFQARRISQRVYNVNSPPEWTPNYWVQVRC